MSEHAFPEMMTVSEVAFALRTTPQTVRALIHEGQLPAARRGGPGAALLVPRPALEEFLFAAPAIEEAAACPP